MKECHRLGIKNFQSNRQPGQINLQFDLCVNDPSAPRHASTKIENYDKIISLLNSYPTKKSTRDWSQLYYYFKLLIHFFINTIYLIFCRMLCFIVKYLIYLVWYLLKIFLCTIFRILTKSVIYRRETFISHPVRCYHHRF
ncbi:hypothetical protein I4U23_013609 [Adineta vaga]|nr:hypothetical protein I4U23_013609 [Adineta vaga]